MDTAVAAEPRPRHPCLAITYAAKAQPTLITEPLSEALTGKLTETLTGTNQPSSKALLPRTLDDEILTSRAPSSPIRN